SNQSADTDSGTWSLENGAAIQQEVELETLHGFICLRPHELSLAIGDQAWLHGCIKIKEYLGAHIRLQVYVKDIGELELHLNPQGDIPAVGTTIGICLNEQHSTQFFEQDIR
ncbi:MAG: TOBE domain-containing protein, partial [Planctomycetes bacterium]|nr:TOBE domain-containing protein [Planctomycetota bacterium]